MIKKMNFKQVLLNITKCIKPWLKHALYKI